MVGNSDSLISVSEGTSISFHQLQDIYNSLTGKTERITLPLTKAYHVKFEDLQQLHAKISQCCDSYGAKIKNESVTVYHISGMKEVFSSFDRFKLYNKSNTEAVENVSLEYNILVVPAGTTRAVTYRIRVDLSSGVGLREKSRELFIGPSSILRILGRSNGQAIVEFTDYAAARHFLTQISEWHQALDGEKDRKWLRAIQANSYWIRLLTPASLCFTYLILTSKYFTENIDKVSPAGVVSFASLVAATCIIFWFLGLILGRTIETSVDHIQPQYYVLLNKGDERLKKKWDTANRRNAIISVVTGGITIALNVASSWIYEALMK